MLRSINVRALAFASIVICSPGIASTLLFESGSYGGPSDGGTSLLDGQFIGARFQVNQPERITRIGGNLGSFSGGIFGAIVRLDRDGFPAGAPTAINPLAVTSFTAGDPFMTSDVSVPLSTTLTPGMYGLVFGSGLFGAKGGGTMAFNNPQLPNVGYFYYTDMLGDIWLEGPRVDADFRFTVYGDFVVPEPPSFLLLGTALLFCFSLRRPYPFDVCG